MNYYDSNYYGRIGEENINNQGEYMKIIEYINCDNIKIMFKETNNIISSTYAHFKSGTVKDRLFYGVTKKEQRVIGNTKSKNEYGNVKKSYNIWNGILKRCCDQSFKERQQAYQECTISEEWLCYENFEKWYNKNYYEVDGEKMCVDKDILVKNNKMYSQDTCLIVPERINSLFKHRRKNKESPYPIGVTYMRDKNLYVSTVKVGDKKIVTYHKNPEDAFCAYKKEKEKTIKQVADKYKSKIPQKLYDAMYRYEIEITD